MHSFAHVGESLFEDYGNWGARWPSKGLPQLRGLTYDGENNNLSLEGINYCRAEVMRDLLGGKWKCSSLYEDNMQKGVVKGIARVEPDTYMRDAAMTSVSISNELNCIISRNACIVNVCLICTGALSWPSLCTTKVLPRRLQVNLPGIFCLETCLARTEMRKVRPPGLIRFGGRRETNVEDTVLSPL